VEAVGHQPLGRPLGGHNHQQPCPWLPLRPGPTLRMRRKNQPHPWRPQPRPSPSRCRSTPPTRSGSSRAPTSDALATRFWTPRTRPPASSTPTSACTQCATAATACPTSTVTSARVGSPSAPGGRGPPKCSSTRAPTSLPLERAGGTSSHFDQVRVRTPRARAPNLSSVRAKRTSKSPSLRQPRLCTCTR